MDKTIKNVLFITHGVNAEQNNGMVDKMVDQFSSDTNFGDWKIIGFEYGKLFPLFAIFPWVTHSLAKKMQRHLRIIQDQYPNAKINVLCHSFGTRLVNKAVKYSDIDTDKNTVKLGKIIFVGGIVSEFERFDDTLGEGQIEKVFNFCSYKDPVIKWQPVFGKCGYHGFIRSKGDKSELKPYKDKNIFNYRFDVGHSDYFDLEGHNFYILWSQILRLR